MMTNEQMEALLSAGEPASDPAQGVPFVYVPRVCPADNLDRPMWVQVQAE